ncbi:MAG: zinc ribbon domain-containing protein [Promethearchaeota archaeon]
MSQMITRKFGLETDTLENVQHLFLKFRDFENLIITTILAHNNDPNFTPLFKRKAKIGYKMAYDYFKINHLAPQTYLRLTFKERMKRAAMYYPYFAIRNYLIRKHNLSRILDCLKVIFHTSPSECVHFLKNGTITRSHLIRLQHDLSKNVYGGRQSLSMEYLTNHLGQLRNLLLKKLGSNRAMNEGIKSALTDPSRRTQLILETLQGFKTQRKRREITIQQEELLGHLKKYFLTAIKRKSTRLFKMYNHREIAEARSPLLQMMHAIGSDNLTAFKRERDGFLASLEMSTDIDLHPLCQEVLAEEIETITSSECPLYQLIAFPFKPIPIASIDEAGFIEYIKMKLRYKIRSLWPAIIFHKTRGIISSVLASMDIIQTQLAAVLKLPRITSLTINLPFREQLWKSFTTDSGHVFRFTPFTKSATTFFQFKLSHTPRKEAGFPDDLFRSPPILKLHRRKLILIQPFEHKGMEMPDLLGNMEMGIDLGLKHFAVISIRDKHKGDEKVRYFLGQKALFGYKFTPETGRFVPLSGVIWNIKRKLIHLRNEVREVQTKKALYDMQFPQDGQRQFHITKTLACLWEKIQRVHLEIRNQLTHRILQIAQFHGVSVIKFEDLSWSKHSRKRISGKWIAYHQIHWFHSKIIHHVAQAAIRVGIQVGVVNARWSSQICSHCAKGHENALKITIHSKKGHLQEYFGSRTSKEFRCNHVRAAKGVSPQIFALDADLNAARNVSMRPVIRVLT